MVRKFRISVVALFVMLATLVQAQVTTSSMSGRVTDREGAIIGATIVATHTPSGTTYGTVTNVEGRFNINGMRVGGPYTVEVSYIGYGKSTMNGVTLRLGENHVLNVVMKEESTTLDEIVISARGSKFNNEKTGASINVNNEQIQTMPSINRSIQDIAKLSPYASGMSFAGGDGRSTNFTIDGANFNNNFGLSSNLPGGGNPISLDAIEEVQVVVAPFDVRQTNFIGGGINAVTKSGTNTFKGSLYTFITNQNLRGNKIGDVDFGEREKNSRTVYGFTAGGPIIKNKLFFFLNGEKELRPGQVVTWRPSENGIADNKKSLSRTSVSDMEKVRKHLMDVYGYDPGSYTNYPGDESNNKLLARIDWNITNNHKLSLRYNYTKNQVWNVTNGNSTDAGYRNRNMNRISEHSMAFSNSLYSMDNVVNSFSFDLNSRFGSQMSNQFISTYTTIKDMRGSNSSPFPFIDIMAGYDVNGNQILEPYMSAGYELFTWNNGVNNKIFNITDNFTMYLGTHKLMFGASFEHQMANNSYMRNGTGYYRYASVDDFLNQRAPRDFALTYGYGGEKNPAAEVSFVQFGVYGQDEWNATDRLKLTLGVRLDNLTYIDNIQRNNAIYNLDFGGRKIDVGEWPKARVQFSPRFGFNYDVLGDKSLTLRGGTGIFSGRLPLVFFTNMPTNSGMVQGSYTAVTKYDSKGKVTSADPNLKNLEGKMITNVDEMIKKLGLATTITPEEGKLPSDINAVDPEFKMPQVWKSSLAFDYKVPVSFPLNVTLEGIYTKTLNGVMLTNYNLKQPDDKWMRFSGADNRYIYPNNITYTNKNAYVLTNTDQGWGATGNVTITAEPVRGLNLMASYTLTESREISGMPGSNAASAYGGLVEVNGPHLPQLERSQYVTPSKAMASVGYKIPYLSNRMSTMVNLFYTGYSSGSYSYTYTNDMNGDGITGDLIYIPAKKGDIKFVSQADEDAFFKFMEQDKYLQKHAGQYAGANAVNAPWTHRFDLKFTQDFRVKVGETVNTLQFSIDILNFGNLLNSTWGITKNMSPTKYGQILKYEGKDANNVPSFSFPKNKDSKGNMVYPTESFATNYYYGETWKLQFGLRYIFN